ncbi:putative glycine-rich cell wall structural protein 1 [Euphorbia lathyris]|uniref:putative glycine-rich cell wall structural protein 1 n=1 Tax=Euphorbia lathyris TaxID=212925 RepID=UPI0033134D45
MGISKTLIIVGLAFAFVLLIASEVSARELAQENGQVEVDDFSEKGKGYGGGNGGYGGGNGKGKGGEYGKGKGENGKGKGGEYGKGKGENGKGKGGYNKPGHGRYPPVAAGETQEAGN